MLEAEVLGMRGEHSLAFLLDDLLPDLLHTLGVELLLQLGCTRWSE